MLKYRGLLITGVPQERPVQAFCQDPNGIRDWAHGVLPKGSKDHVIVYRVEEIEIATLRRDDKGAIKGIKPITEEAK